MNRFVSIKFEIEQEKLILRTNTIINNSNMGNVAKKRWIYLLNRNRFTNIHTTRVVVFRNNVCSVETQTPGFAYHPSCPLSMLYLP